MGGGAHIQCSTLTEKLRLSPKTAEPMARALHILALEGRIAPLHCCPREATIKNPRALPDLQRSLPEGGMRLPIMAPTPFPNHHAP